jgi:6-phosphogluconolactonase
VKCRLYIGTDADNGGAGLHPLDYSEDTGWHVGKPYPEARNASFAAYSERHDLYYLVDERPEGSVGVFRITSDGWDPVGRVRTGGAAPCYVALNDAQDRLAITNYGSGSVALFRLDDRTGLPLGAPDVRQNEGGGPVEDRQDGPHAHCACFSPDQRWLYHVDLGTDAILAYRLDPATGTLGERRVAFSAPAGSGPRHLVFHPTLPLALLVSELASTLTLLTIAEDGALEAIHTLSTLPDGFTGKSIAGHLSRNRAGTRIYVTNRGHDSIAVFAWPAGGTPELLQHRPSGGASPRAFVLLEEERQFVLTNEESGNVTLFGLLADGTLGPCHHDLAVPGAVFVFVAPQ